MMRLSKKAIDEFKDIYFKKYGVLLTDEQANELGVELLEFFKLIYKPLPKN